MGLVSVTNITDGSTVDAADVNSNINAIANELNGNIESVNIKDATITSSKIADGTISTLDIANESVTNAKLESAVQTKLGYLSAPDDNWHAVGDAGEPAFQNSWVNYNATFNPCGYYKDALGWVHLRGLVKNGTDEAVIFTLPVGYRPEHQHLFVIMSADLVGRLDITTAGAVDPAISSNVWISLDNIIFKAYQ